MACGESCSLVELDFHGDLFARALLPLLLQVCQRRQVKGNPFIQFRRVTVSLD